MTTRLLAPGFDLTLRPMRYLARPPARASEITAEAVDCQAVFAEDVLGGGVVGMALQDMREDLEYVADQRLAMLRLAPRDGARKPFPFMDLQDVRELTNFFERRVSACQVAVQGEVGFDHAYRGGGRFVGAAVDAAFRAKETGCMLAAPSGAAERT